jgi:CubicO group peptidase (beta-lactamase class C family)
MTSLLAPITTFLAAILAGRNPPAAPAPQQPPTTFLAPDAIGTALDTGALERAAAYSEQHSGRALLVLKEGEIVFERYANGWSAGRPHPLASGTKSFVGLVAAAAIADGLITLDEVVSDSLVEWKEDPRKSRITVRQLLDLSSGLAPNSDRLGPAGAGIRDLGRVNGLAGRLRGGALEAKPANRFAAVVEVEAVDEPGRTFRYGPTHFYAFGAFLQRKLEQSDRPERTYWDYFMARVLAPAGVDIGVERFAPDAAHQPNLPGGGHLTAREWARFGEFVRTGGRSTRPDAPGIPREHIDACFEPSKANPNYGLTWWLLNGRDGASVEIADGGGFGLGRRIGRQAARQAAQTKAITRADGTELRAAMAAGAGKQRLYILPDDGLVIVRFAEMGLPGRGFDDTIFIRTLLGLPAEQRHE